MRVLHVVKDVDPPVKDGIARHVGLVRASMPDVQSDVIVGARRWSTSLHRVGTGVEVRVGEFGRPLSVPIAPALPIWQRRLRPDLVHLHMPNPAGELSTLVATDRKTPILVSYHADIVRQTFLMPAYAPLVEKCLNRAQAIVVGNTRSAERSPFLSSRRSKVHVIPYGVDCQHFRRERVAEGERADLRERYGTPMILSVGRLVYYKGFEHLIEAASNLAASVVIAGAGPLEGRLRAQARNLPRVHFAGGLSEAELLGHYAAADCFVLPSSSRAESFGIATLEAQSMELPAVVTDVGTGTVEAIEAGVTGLVVPPGDPPNLADAITRILADPEKSRAMGAAARERVLAYHSATAQAAALRNVYQCLVEGGGGA
jgi:glycosyltransferase involved in cell wall biosynthesis